MSESAATHPLIAQLFAKHGFAEVTPAGIDAFASTTGRAMLVFLDDPLRVRETLDIAVIVPELARVFAGRFRVGVLLPEAARALAPRYGFRRWPALVILRDGAYIGAVDGLRNWDDYLTEIGELLEADPVRPPTVGVPVKSAHEQAQGACAARLP
ncbi:MAG TPA: hydrogenase [Casimicrobiaceae bacterium]|nr:hydrogenase [Casimicrobiaceae bacterium]